MLRFDGLPLTLLGLVGRVTPDDPHTSQPPFESGTGAGEAAGAGAAGTGAAAGAGAASHPLPSGPASPLAMHTLALGPPPTPFTLSCLGLGRAGRTADPVGSTSTSAGTGDPGVGSLRGLLIRQGPGQPANAAQPPAPSHSSPASSTQVRGEVDLRVLPCSTLRGTDLAPLRANLQVCERGVEQVRLGRCGGTRCECAILFISVNCPLPTPPHALP